VGERRQATPTLLSWSSRLWLPVGDAAMVRIRDGKSCGAVLIRSALPPDPAASWRTSWF
jgi:hypothetical protein